MEKHLNKHIEAYIIKFKDDIRQKINDINFDEKKKINELIEYVYEYTKLQLEKEDVIKRKRVKNAIPNANRCIGKLANDERCTRRRKKDSDFCGTHIKGTPNGSIQIDAAGEYNKDGVFPKQPGKAKKNCKYCIFKTLKNTEGKLYCDGKES
jgi:hypothetical protein